MVHGKAYTDPLTFTLQQDETYYKLAHAVQCATKHDANIRHAYDMPEKAVDIRIGLNIAMSGMSALCVLLIRKGILTHAEVADVLIEGLRSELARFEELYPGTTFI